MEAKMGQIDTAIPSEDETLPARMILLARLSERIGPGPRRLRLDEIVRRMMLFRRMSERLNLAAPETALMRGVFREAELGCLDCAEWRRCREWLDGRAPDEDYRDFCPNEGLFGVLPRQNNVTRPRAPE
jgi:hypothetical protein